MFIYQSRFLRRGEVWFDNNPTSKAVDWILYRNRPDRRPGAKWRYFFNRLIDLSKSPEDLLFEMEAKTREKIRIAETQDRISCEWCDLTTAEELDAIERMWNQSKEAQRRWGPLDRVWLEEMISARALELAAARGPSGTAIVHAIFFKDKRRVQQLLSVSPFCERPTPEIRAKTNRANCLLVWQTLLRLKKRNVGWFDFGGWYPGTEDIQLLGANAYKKSFGGQVVREFECEQVVTIKGWVVLNAARMIARAKAVAPKVS
jgi:hypothetical protein